VKPRHLEILQHALGLDQYGQGASHRNYFCAGEGDEADCRELVAAGLMVEHGQRKWLPYYNCSVTEAGREAVNQHSPKPPKLTRSQQRYRRFLAADCGMRFREWIEYEMSKGRA
jgi:hypothetical protein